jgi:hypothetical protein
VYLLRGSEDDALRFDQSGIARFEDEAPSATRGYAYYSSAVPRGERRGQRSHAVAETETEAEAEAAVSVELQDEPLPLDVLFQEVPKAEAPATTLSGRNG